MITLNKLIKTLIYFGFIIIIIQKSPAVIEKYYEQFRIAIYVIFGMIVMLTLFTKGIKSSSFLKYNYLFLILQSIIFLIFHIFNLYINWFDLIEVAIPLSVMYIGLKIKFSERELKIFSASFFIFSMFITAWQIYYYQGDFFIRETYTIPLKNSMGPFLVISLAMNIYLMLIRPVIKKIKDKLGFAILLLALMLGIYFILIIRSRSSILALFIFMLIIFIKKHGYKVSAIAVLTLSIVLVVIPKARNYVFGPIITAFMAGKNITDLEDFSSNRIGIYKEAIKLIKEDPLFGISKRYYNLYGGTPHNYIINKLYLYGIIGSIFFILIYLLFVLSTIKNTLIMPPTFNNMGAFIFIVPLIISIFEYSYPFGPGTSNIIAYFLLSKNKMLVNKQR